MQQQTVFSSYSAYYSSNFFNSYRSNNFLSCMDCSDVSLVSVKVYNHRTSNHIKRESHSWK